MEMQHMVDEAKDILSNGHSLSDFGKLMHESWQLKRSLSDKISNAEIDKIYEAARKAGALGGKLLGAGGGGFMIFFVRPEHQAKVRQKLKKLLEVKFRFEFGGSQIIFARDDVEQSGQYKTI